MSEHTIKAFDVDLQEISRKVAEMGGLAEKQIADSIVALSRRDVMLAQRVIAPRLGPKKPVPGPPKRFAQGMGAVMATTALVFALPLGDHAAADVVLGFFVVAAGLESIFAYCLGCKVFAGLMRVGVVPRSMCEECADISSRWTVSPGSA